MSRTALPLLVLAFGCRVFAGEELFRAAAESNINQRYTIESIAISGVQVDEAKLPSSLRRRMNALIGKHCDVAALQDLAADLRRELHLREVNHHLLRGSQPDRVRVDFSVVKKPVDLAVPKFLYNSRQGFTGEVNATTQFGQNTLMMGAVSNGDDLTERFTGVVARWNTALPGTDRVTFGVGFEDFHEQWNSATRTAAEATPSQTTPSQTTPSQTTPSQTTPLETFDLYRARRNIAPSLTFTVARPLTVSVGTSFEQTKPENPLTGDRSANAFTAEIRYGRKIEGDTVQQTVEGKYDLRAGSRSLGSDYSYSRHMVTFRYEIASGRQTASDELTAGAISGDSPMFERFVLGSSSTLRGWDRYAIDPLGGDHMIHNSLTYGYRFGERTAEVFYDSGALWNYGRSAELRHSLGVGYRQGVFMMTMAFPVVQGRIEPVFMAGMNY